MIDIYTDGACSGNPGPGGWAALVIEDGRKRVLRGGEDRTTNNRMEIIATIEGLKSIPANTEVTVHTDSTYVVNTMTRGWKRKANQDLWAALDGQVRDRRVTWQWVRGHSGHALNEEADSVAVAESRSRMNSNGAESGGAPSGGSRAAPSGGGGDDEAGPAAALTHVDEAGRASMVDVGAKAETRRVAVAEGRVAMNPETLGLIRDNAVKKGDVLGVARVAGIMAAKRTPDLIPLCHPLPIDSLSVELELDEAGGCVRIEATAATTAKTGVEMEALTAVSAAALTVYDMCKAVERTMRIEGIRLVSKTGGRSDFTAGT